MSDHYSSFKQVLKRDKIFVGYFYLPNCRSCKKMVAFFEYLTVEYPMFDFAKIDVNQAEDIAEELKISRVPTLIAFKNSKEIKRYTGDSNGDMESFMESLKSKV